MYYIILAAYGRSWVQHTQECKSHTPPLSPTLAKEVTCDLSRSLFRRQTGLEECALHPLNVPHVNSHVHLKVSLISQLTTLRSNTMVQTGHTCMLQARQSGRQMTKKVELVALTRFLQAQRVNFYCEVDKAEVRHTCVLSIIPRCIHILRDKSKPDDKDQDLIAASKKLQNPFKDDGPSKNPSMEKLALPKIFIVFHEAHLLTVPFD
ncbi:hypothetical protein EDB83DRAFT_2315980 [Lactarius deliciosus]|nr:hypothetical protein EDB83DRAFT_2315980 [Lactarius deliciosus]